MAQHHSYLITYGLINIPNDWFQFPSSNLAEVKYNNYDQVFVEASKVIVHFQNYVGTVNGPTSITQLGVLKM